MKNNQIQDERILAERRQIQSRGYAWVVLVLLASIVIQQFFIQAPFKQNAAEFCIMIGCGVYNIIATYKKGIDIWNPKGDGKEQSVPSTVISESISVALFAILSGTYKGSSLAIYLVALVVFLFVNRLVMIGINNKKQAQINKALDIEEEE